MKPPKCRTCGHRHPLGAPCTETIPEKFERKAADLGFVKVTDPIRKRALTELSKPLTPAEKQKTYRERYGDKVREANRLRMRRKRGG